MFLARTWLNKYWEGASGEDESETEGKGCQMDPGLQGDCSGLANPGFFVGGAGRMGASQGSGSPSQTIEKVTGG